MIQIITILFHRLSIPHTFIDTAHKIMIWICIIIIFNIVTKIKIKLRNTIIYFNIVVINRDNILHACLVMFWTKNNFRKNVLLCTNEYPKQHDFPRITKLVHKYNFTSKHRCNKPVPSEWTSIPYVIIKWTNRMMEQINLISQYSRHVYIIVRTHGRPGGTR